MRRKIVELISGNLLNIGLNGFLGIYVARVLGPEARGILALVMGAVLLASMLISFGSPHSASYFIRAKPQSAKAILFYWNRMLAIGAIVSTVASFFAGDFFASFFLGGYPIDLVLVLLVVGLIIASSDTGVVGASIIARGDSRKFNLGTNIGTAVTFLIALLLLNMTDWKLHAVLTGYLAGQATTALLLRRAFSNYIDPSGLQNDEVIGWIDIFSYGWKAQIGSIASLVFKRVDLFIIGYLIHPGAVGLYSIGLSLRDLALTVPRAMAGIIGGEMTDHQVQSSGLGLRLLKKSFQVNVGFSTAVALLGLLTFPMVIPLVYGHAYQEAVLPAILILFSLIPLSLAIIVNPAICAYGKPMHMSMGNVIGGFLGLIAIWYSTNRFGLVGAAISTIIASSILLAVNMTIFNFFVRQSLAVANMRN